MKRYSLFFSALLLTLIFASNIFSQPQYYNLNNGTSSNSFPFNVAGGKAVNSIFLAGEFNQPSPLPSGQQITKVYFRTSTAGSRTYTNLHILLAQDVITTLTTGAFYSGTMDTVYFNASATLNSTVGGWMEVTLNTPYPYDPTKSLILFVGHCGATGTAGSVYNTTLTGVRRVWSVAGCPYTVATTTGDAAMLNFGVDVIPVPVNCSFTWGPQTSGVVNNFFSVKAVNGLIAWASGAGATIRKTTDGGTTWTNGNPNPGVITGDVYNIEAIDGNNAWCTTSPGATFIYKTTNGGTNWVQVFTQAAPSFINAIKMASPTVGIATGDPVGGNWVILGTTDAGSTWTPISTPAGTGDGRNNCLHVSLPNVWFGTGQGSVWRSTNAGLNWSSAPTAPLTTQVLGIHFQNASTGVVSGSSMVRTTDGGATWAAVTVPGTGNISGISGSGSDYWCVRGTGVYRSSNDGVTWTLVHTAVGTGSDLKITTGTNGCLTGWSVATGGNIAKMNGSPVAINNHNNQIPNTYMLEQNYPNPFNPTTSIRFAIPKSGIVKLFIYDVLGREVAVLVNEFRSAGSHSVDFDASHLSSGIYLYKIETGDFVETKKMMLVK